MTQQLQEDIVRRFGVTHAVAEKMIKKASAKAQRKAAVTTALRRPVRAADETNFEEDPAAWRNEVQRRMQAIEIMEEGVKELKDMAKLMKRVIEAEQKLIATKIGSVNKKDDDWWDMQHSGWAMGGREMFAQKLFNILNGLDEGKLAIYIMDKIGFKRSIPIDEEDVAPLIPMDIAPGQAMPGEMEKEEPVPEDAEDVEAMLVRGAARTTAAPANKNKVKRYMQKEAQHVEDRRTGEVNTTQLAENAAHEFDHDEWLDDETHWVWDLAVDVVEWYEKQAGASAVTADAKADIEKWIKSATKHIEKITKESPPREFMQRTLGFTKGKKYYRVYIERADEKGADRSAYCFIDMEGNIYKADSWKRPAKGIRGTVHDVDPDSIDQYTSWLYRR